jgi:hypothetical protein
MASISLGFAPNFYEVSFFLGGGGVYLLCVVSFILFYSARPFVFQDFRYHIVKFVLSCS